MPRWFWFLPLGGLVLAGVALALLLGGRAATTTENEVIERVADLHEAEGGQRTDCHAMPARSEGLWLVVICEAKGGFGTEYFIDRYGRVADTQSLGGDDA